MRPFAHRADSAGFTLIELLIGSLIAAIIAGAVATALIVSFDAVGATSDEVAQSHDAQDLSFWLLPDLQSLGPSYAYTDATRSTGPSTNICTGTLPSGTYVLNLSWTDTTVPVTYQSDYYSASDASGQLVLNRYFCSSASPAPTTVTIIHHLASAGGSVVFCYPSSTPACSLPTLTVSTVGPAGHVYTFSISGGGR